MEFFDDTEFDQLASTLYRLTEKGRLDWKQIGDSPYTFGTQVADTVFGLESRDKDDMAPHIFTVYSMDGGELKTLQELDSTYANTSMAERLDDLYQVVKRRTLKIDVVAKNILAQLAALDEDDHTPLDLN